jgi:hypothetical protein
LVADPVLLKVAREELGVLPNTAFAKSRGFPLWLSGRFDWLQGNHKPKG